MSNGRIDQVFNLPAIETQFKKVFSMMHDLTRMILELEKTAAGINLGGRRDSGAASQTQQAVNAAQQLERAQQRLATAESNLGRMLAETNEKTRQQNVANRQAAREAVAHSTSLDGMRAALARLTREYDRMTATQRASRAEGGRQVQQIQQLQREIRELENLTGRAQRNVGNYPRQLVGGVQGFLGGAGLGVGLGVAGAGVAAKAIFDVTRQLDSLNIALRAVSGSEEEFARNQAFLIGLSDKLGLNILQLTDSYKSFYASSTQAGLSADQTRMIFDSVAQAGSRLKLSNEQIEGAFLALGQTISKGKVQAEELRGQLAERIPGANAIAAKSLGVTEERLNKMLERGEVVASDFLPRFANELRKVYGMNGPAEGLQASINRLSNTFTKLVSNNQSGLTKFFTTIVDLAGFALDKINKLTTGFAFLYNKIADPAAAERMTDEGAIAKLRDQVQSLLDNADVKQGDKVAQLLQLRNNLDANLTREEERLSRIESSFRAIENSPSAKKVETRIVPGVIGPGAIEETSAFDRTKKILDDQIASVNLMRRQRQVLIDALRGATGAGTDMPPMKAATASDKELKDRLERERRMREMALKSTLEGYRIDKEAAIASMEEIINNEKLGIDTRLEALANYNDLRNMLAKEEARVEKELLNDKVKNNEATAQDILNVDKKLSADQQQILRDTAKKQAEIIKQNADGAIAERLAALERQKEKLEESEAEELGRLREMYDNRILSLEQYETAELQVRNKYAVLALEAEIETTRQIIELRRARGEDVTDLEKAVGNARKKLYDLDFEFFKKNEQKKTKTAEEELALREEREKQFKEKIEELVQETAKMLFAFANARYENEKNKIADQIELVKKQKDKEIEAVNASTLSAQEKADRIAVIEARAQTREEQLEARRRQIQIQQARFERQQAIAGIILNTSMAVMKTLSAGGPFTIPLAAAIAAIGAAQLATALAAPLPRYRTGRDGGPAEWAVVNDGGMDEVIEHKDGSAYIAAGRNAITFLDEGDKVHRSVDHYVHSISQKANGRAPGMEVDGLGRLRIREDIDRQTKELVGAMARNKSTTIVKNTWAGVQVSQENAAGFFRYISKNVYE